MMSSIKFGPVFRKLTLVFACLTLFAAGACSDSKSDDFQAEGRKLMEQGNASGAVVFFKNALEKDPTDFSVRFDLGKAYFKLGKAEQAEQEFQKCLLQQPDNAELNYEFAKLSSLYRKPDDVLKYLAVAEKTMQPTAESKELAASAYSMKGMLPEAESKLNEALSIDPSYSSASTALVRLYIAQRRNQDALLLVEEILEDQPEFVDALRLRADMAMGFNDFDKAAESYGKITKLQPMDESAMYMLGLVRLRENDLEAAAAVRDTMIQRFKDTYFTHMLSGMVAYQTMNYSEAANSFQKSVDLRPSLEGYYRLALSQKAIGNLESSLSNLRSLLDGQPQNASALQLAAQILMQQDRIPEAQQEAEKLVGFYPNSASAHFLLGSILRAKGDNDASLRSYKRALEIDPGMSEALLARTNVLMAEKRYDEATQELNIAIQKNANDLAARTALFNYYLGRRDYRAAAGVVDEGLKESPDSAPMLTMKGALLASQQKEQEALEVLAKARAIDPNFGAAFQIELRLHMLAGRNEEALALCNDYLLRHPDSEEYLVLSASLLDQLDRKPEATSRLQKAYDEGSNRALIIMVRRDLADKKPEQAEQRLRAALDKDPSPSLRGTFAEFYLGQGQVDKAWNLYDSIELASAGEAAIGKYRLLVATGRHEEALRQARHIAKVDPSSSMGPVCVAEALERLGGPADALSELEAAYRSTQDQVLLAAMAGVASRMGQHDKAEAYYGTVLRQAPNNRPALMGQGTAFMHQKKYDHAIASFERAHELMPSDVIALNNLAMAYAEQGKDVDNAVQLATRAYVNNPENPQIIDTLAFCLMRAKRNSDAAAILEKAVVAHSDNALLKYRLGTALIDSGKAEDGVTCLQQALDMGGFSYENEAKELIRKHQMVSTR